MLVLALIVLGFSAFQYNTTVKPAILVRRPASRFSAFQYNTTVKRTMLRS